MGMALDDDDRQEIARMIADNSKPAQRPRSAPIVGQERPTQSQWDQMNDRDQSAYVRSMVEDILTEQDKEYERQSLRAENEELKAKVAEWEKGGKRGPKPKSGDSDKREEQAPTVVSKAAAWLFGQPNAHS